MKFVISSYNRNGNSICLFEFKDNELKKLSCSDVAAPSFIVRDKQYLYTFEKMDKMRLLSYQIVKDKLVLNDTFIIPGTGITHLAYSKKNKMLLGCSYGDGTFFSVGVENGMFTKVYTYSKQIEDDRLSRCHCVLLNKNQTNVAIVNIALDEVYLYDIVKRMLVFKDIIKLPDGVGPRHAIYNCDNSFMYIISEYSNEIFVVSMETKNISQRISTVYKFTKKTNGATLLFSKNEKYLYASNRGEDSIAKFKVLDSRMLEYVNSFSCGGFHPRHMKLSEDGGFIISCNMHSDNVAIIDLKTQQVIKEIPFTEASGVEFID